MFWDYLWLIWVLSSLLFIRFYLYLFAHHSKLIAKPVKEKFGTPKIIFQVTTKGNIGIVQDTINRINAVCKEIGYTKYRYGLLLTHKKNLKDAEPSSFPQIIGATLFIKAEHYSTQLKFAEKKK